MAGIFGGVGLGEGEGEEGEEGEEEDEEDGGHLLLVWFTSILAVG
jgi:hypothetical protein